MAFPASVALRARTRGTVSVACEELGGREVVLVESDPFLRRGALQPEDGRKIAEAAILARQLRRPLVALLASSGADVHEGVAALAGWGDAARQMAACSGIVPTVVAVDGPAVSGPALLLGLADQVVLTEHAYAFVSGPSMVRDFTGEDVSNQTLGGSGVHARQTGLATLVVPDAVTAREAVGDLLQYLPGHADELPPLIASEDPFDRPTPEAGEVVPELAAGSYDMRDLLRALVDDGELLELRDGWAPNLVTALACFDGRPVGVVANQPKAIAGTLDIAASQKGARFVAFCDAFNLPLVTVVDTPGFYPGKDLEWRGMIRHGAQLAFAYARATVPRLCLVVRKSYGGAYIVMDSRYMGNDLYLAWPSAELAVMGAGQAAAVLMRRADASERARFEADYVERLLNPYVAAARGSVDVVTEPRDTRRVLCAALAQLSSKREALVGRRHDNSPV
ncbi:MAG: methylmalonyl-CoA carboxyltransferase [Acidimicrobiia bacterium]|nr:methylmalonyl-CoA carboxyltransferase [Acidimicrobiia bacterium]